MFKIREFSVDDIEYALALTDLIGWGYSEKDFSECSLSLGFSLLSKIYLTSS